MNEKNILILSIKDFLTPKMLKYSILPFIISLILIYALFLTLASIGVEQLGVLHVQTSETTLQNGIPHTQNIEAEVEGSEIIKFLMKYSITSWLATIFIYALSGFVALYISIFVAVIIIGFLTPIILKELRARHYDSIEMRGYANLFNSIFFALKTTLIMLLLFIALIPFYFIPFLNIIAINIPLYYFFHKMILFDISSNILTKEEAKKIAYFNANGLRLKTLFLYLVSLIPFVVFFAAIFFIIYLGHTYFLEAKKIRTL